MSSERVHLVIEGAGRREAAVARAVPGAAELILLTSASAAPLPARFLHGRRCRARPADGDGSLSVEGTLRAVPDDEGCIREGVIQLLTDVPETADDEDAPPSAPPQRRVHDRVDAIRPVTVVPERFGAGWLDLRTRDISSGGVLVEDDGVLRTGERVRLVLELGSGVPLGASGRVVRTSEEGLAGIRFDPLGSVEARRLERHLELRRQGEIAARRAAEPH